MSFNGGQDHSASPTVPRSENMQADPAAMGSQKWLDKLSDIFTNDIRKAVQLLPLSNFRLPPWNNNV